MSVSKASMIFRHAARSRGGVFWRHPEHSEGPRYAEFTSFKVGRFAAVSRGILSPHDSSSIPVIAKKITARKNAPE
jgi:hypothetical protein